MSRHLERGQLLVQSNRFEEAIKEFSLELANNPENPLAHCMLGICFAQLQQFDQAIQHGERAVSLAPDVAYLHSQLAMSYLVAQADAAALQAAENALRCDPGDTVAHYVIGAVRSNNKDWEGALAAAEQALAYDPEDIDARNLRSMALRNLGQATESIAEAKRSLAQNAENPHSHANLGWTYLRSGDLQQAEVHFREALRLDPNLETARVGVLETLKSKVPVYRWILGYFFWIASKTAKWQIAILFGMYFAMRLLRGIIVAAPATTFILLPIIICYGLFCATTWFAGPLSNALLVLHPFGRLALTRWERLGGMLTGGALTATTVLLLASFFESSGLLFLAGLGAGVLTIPIAMTCQMRQPKQIWCMVAVTSVSAVIVIGTILGIPQLEPWFFYIPLGSIIAANVLSLWQ